VHVTRRARGASGAEFVSLSSYDAGDVAGHCGCERGIGGCRRCGCVGGRDVRDVRAGC